MLLSPLQVGRGGDGFRRSLLRLRNATTLLLLICVAHLLVQVEAEQAADQRVFGHFILTILPKAPALPALNDHGAKRHPRISSSNEVLRVSRTRKARRGWKAHASSAMEAVVEPNSGETTVVALSPTPPISQNISLRYWETPEEPESRREEDSGKVGYLTFESDGGGLNNMRMALEYFVQLAKRSGRTLVLPPKEGWYLIDWGPMNKNSEKSGEALRMIDGKKESSYEEFWDVEALGRAIPVLSAKAFYERRREQLKIPKGADPGNLDHLSNTPDQNPWKSWLFDYAESLAGLGPAGPRLEDGPEATVCEAAERLAMDHSKSLVHFPFNEHHGRTYRFFRCACRNSYPRSDPEYGGADFLHFHPKLFEAAEQAAGLMMHREAANSYAAVHLRRNDFQGGPQAQDAESSPRLLQILEERLAPGEPVYISSDEMETAYIHGFRDKLAGRNHSVFSLSSFDGELGQVGSNRRYSGPIEMLICAGSRLFLGTKGSTFTGGINDIRLYHLAQRTGTVPKVGTANWVEEVSFIPRGQ